LDTSLAIISSGVTFNVSNNQTVLIGTLYSFDQILSTASLKVYL